MKAFEKKFELRWADVDANLHVMHSKYYELGAHCRMSFLLNHGLSVEVMQEYKISPILFREECIFRRELNAGEVVTVNMLLTKRTADAGKWSVRHEIIKEDGVIAAVINADLSWIDLTKRKIGKPVPVITAVVDLLEKSTDFTLLP
jgi:acyl-CoA thioester hydrolase